MYAYFLKALQYWAKKQGIVNFNPLIMLKMFGEMYQKEIATNPYFKKLLSLKEGSPEYKKTYEKYLEHKKNIGAGAVEPVKEMMDVTSTKSPNDLFNKIKTSPEQVTQKIKGVTYEKQKKLADGFIVAANAEKLSSSWLAYGSFIPNNPKIPTNGKLKLVTKDSKTLIVINVKFTVWEKMVRQIGITTYKKGKRFGKDYGAGTILHKYTNKKLWKWGKI